MYAYRWSKQYVLYELPCVEGFAFKAWYRENNGLVPAERDSEGYIAQESERLRAGMRE
jgi:hypothetical protein